MSDAMIAMLAEIGEGFGFLTPLGPAQPLTIDQQERVIEVAFDGADQGCVRLALAPGLAQQLVANVTGDNSGAEFSPADLESAASELTNVIAGNLLVALYGAEREFRLGSPQSLPPTDVSEGEPLLSVEFMEGVMTLAVLARKA